MALFDYLAEFILKRHKAIIVFWVVALIIATPFMLKLNEVLQYSQTSMLTGDVESVKANEIMQGNFPKFTSNSTAMIIIRAENLSSPAGRDLVLGIEDNVSALKLNVLDSIMSVYSMTGFYMVQIAEKIHPAMYPMEQQLGELGQLIYGVPALYLNIYLSIPNGSDMLPEERSNQTLLSAQIQVNASFADEVGKATALGYINSLHANWIASFNNSSPLYLDNLSYDEMTRMSITIHRTAPVFFNLTDPANFTRTQQVMALVLNTLNLTTFNSTAAVHQIMLAAISQALPGMVLPVDFLEGLYSLGPQAGVVNISQYCSGIIRNGTLDTYPISLPPEYRSSFISPDNRTAIVIVGFSRRASEGSKDVENAVKDIRRIRDEVIAKQNSMGLEIVVSGDAAIFTDMKENTRKDIYRIEPVTLVLVLVLMGLFFLSIVTPAIPIAAMGVTLVIIQAILFYLGSTVFDIPADITTFLFSLLMGAGVDYCIFILARYKEERVRGLDRYEGVKESVRWAGKSITTSGLSVIIGFLALSVGSFSMVRTMGIVLSLAFVLAIIISLTLIPSIMTLIGNKVFWPSNKRWKKESQKDAKPGLADRYFTGAGEHATKYAWPIVIAAVLLTGPAVYVVLNIDLGYDMISSMAECESTDGLDIMADSFGAGNIMPTYVVVRFDTPFIVDGRLNRTRLDAIDNLTTRLAMQENVKSVRASTYYLGYRIDRLNLESVSAAEAAPILATSIGYDNSTVVITLILEDRPYTKYSLETIDRLREEVREAKGEISGLSGTEVLVGGQTALMHDISTLFQSDLPAMAGIVIAGIFILLLIVVASVIIPLTAIFSIGLSIFWALAATILVFKYGFGIDILWLMPIVLFAIMMGLGMDYNIFLVTRVREEKLKGKLSKEAITEAVHRTGGIISMCGIVMATAFGMLMLSSNDMMKEFGFALAFAVILDTFVVRVYLMPALLHLFGEANWWLPFQNSDGNRKKGTEQHAQQQEGPDGSINKQLEEQKGKSGKDDGREARAKEAKGHGREKKGSE
ncbi:MAG: MMPL family transporter [Thermoplasmata archaeon]